MNHVVVPGLESCQPHDDARLAAGPGVRVVAVEPTPGSVPTRKRPHVDTVEGVHRVTGVEADLLPTNFDESVVDAFIPCETRGTRAATRTLAREEGLFAGPSSGADLHAASALPSREHAGKTIVAIFAGGGER